MRRLLSPLLLLLVLAAGLAATSTAGATPPAYATHPAANGCPKPFAGGFGSRFPDYDGCPTWRNPTLVPARPGVLLGGNRLLGWEPLAQAQPGAPWLRVGRAGVCLGRAGCVDLRGMSDGNGTDSVAMLYAGAEGTLYAGSEDGVAVVEVAADGTLSQPAGPGGCVSWAGRDGCAAGPGPLGPGFIVLGVTARALYVAAGGRVHVLAITAHGLEALTGAGSCLSTDGSDGSGDPAGCIDVPLDGSFDARPLDDHLVVDGSFTDPACPAADHVCRELLILGTDAGTGAIRPGVTGCIGAATGCVAPPGLAPPDAGTTGVETLPAANAVVVTRNGRADIIDISPDGVPFQRAGASRCIDALGSGGCTAVGANVQQVTDVEPLPGVLALAGGDGSTILVERDAATGALSRRPGVDGCIGVHAPCHRVGAEAPRRGAVRYVLLMPDGTGAVDSQEYGHVALEPQSPPTCTSPAVEAWIGGTTATTSLCSDPNGDPVSYGVTSPPRRGTLAAAGTSLTWRPGPGPSARATATITASDAPGRATAARVALRALAPPAPTVERVRASYRLGRYRGGQLWGTFFGDGITVVGRFVDELGRPLSRMGATVAAGGGAKRVLTARDGSFKAPLGGDPPQRSGRIAGRVLRLPGGLVASRDWILVSPKPIWERYYRIVGDELWLPGRLRPANAAREGTMRSEVSSGGRWRPLAAVPVTRAGRFVLRAPGPGLYRIVWTPKRGHPRFNGFSWRMRLSPPRAPAGRTRAASRPAVVDLGGRVTP